jgi:hypothetical protein
MKMTSLFFLACVLLAGDVLAGERVSVADIKITFARVQFRPSGVPREALNAGIKPDRDAAKGGSSAIEFGIVKDSRSHGALTNIVAGRISALRVTWANLSFIKNAKQIPDFLRERLSATNGSFYAFHIWSYADGAPDVVATVEHTEGTEGKLYIWGLPSLACAYLDGNGKWWWGSWPQVVPKPFTVNMDAIPWGEAADGLRLAAMVDEPNGVIHAWVRNGGTNSVSYNEFDFGYWEFVGLEVLQGTNWVNVPRTTGGIACGGCHAAGKVKRLTPKEVITGMNWLHYEIKPEHGRLIPSEDGKGWRSTLGASFFYDDTFTLDLGAFRRPASALPQRSLEARVRQDFYPDLPDAKKVTFYSPVFTLNASTIALFDPESPDRK